MDRSPGAKRAGLAALILLAVVVVGVGANHLAGSHWPRSTPSSTTVFENASVRVTLDRVIQGLAVRTVRDSALYATEDRFVYRSEDWGESFETIGKLGRAQAGSFVRARDALLRSPLVRLLRRSEGPENLTVLSSGTVIVMYGGIHRLPDGADVAEPIDHPADDFASPLPHSITTDRHDRVFVAEYRTDGRPQSPRVLRGSDDGRTWELCHQFPEGEVFHVHAVRYDPYRDRILLTTGDRDAESHLYELDGECGGVTRIGGGSQDWRIVAPVPTDTALVWGSDNTLTEEGPGIFVKDTRSGDLERVEDLPKPSYYAGRLRDGTVTVSATATPPHPEVPGSADSTSLWLSRDLERWHRVYALAKADLETEWGPARGQLAVPTGTHTAPYIFASPRYTTKGSPMTLRFRVEWKEGP